MNPIHDLKFHSLKNSLPKNKNEAFDKLIIHSIMTLSTKIEHDKLEPLKESDLGSEK